MSSTEDMIQSVSPNIGLLDILPTKSDLQVMPLSLDSDTSAKHSFIGNLHLLLVCNSPIPTGSLKLYHTNEMKSGCNTSKPILQSRDGHKMDWGSRGLYIGTDRMAVIELANRRKGALLPIGSCLFSAFVPLE